jgi:hypothetical protein
LIINFSVAGPTRFGGIEQLYAEKTSFGRRLRPGRVKGKPGLVEGNAGINMTCIVKRG